MQLFGRRARADSHGRYHLSCDEMAELYRGFHLALTDTYWETAANHKICNDAMEAIRTTHISNKSGRFLKNFTALTREVYSHAHYNVQELLYEERDTVRQEYFTNISRILDVVLRRAEHIWSTPCSDKLSVLLQFAALYSLYKDVAEEDFIQKIYGVAVNGMQFQQTHKNKKDQTDDDRMYDYFDQIQLVFRLRKEIRRGSITEEKRTLPSRRTSIGVPSGPLLEHRQSRLATKEELDEFFDKIMKEQQRQRRHKQKPSPVEEEEGHEPQLDMWVSSSSAEDHEGGKRLSFHLTVTAHEEHRQHEDHGHLEMHHKKGGRSREPSPSANRRGSFVHLPEIMSVLKKLNPVHHHPKPEEPAPEMGEFDYKAEFEKRFAKRQSVGSVSVDLPIIAKPKPNPMDRVTSYRRRGLFNDRNPIRRAESESKSSEEPIDAKDEEEEQKENCVVPLSDPTHLTLDTLVPPPKPPRAHSPRTMERIMIQAVVNEATVDDVVQV